MALQQLAAQFSAKYYTNGGIIHLISRRHISERIFASCYTLRCARCQPFLPPQDFIGEDFALAMRQAKEAAEQLARSSTSTRPDLSAIATQNSEKPQASPLESVASRDAQPPSSQTIFPGRSLDPFLLSWAAKSFIVPEPLDCVRHSLRLMLHEQAVYAIYDGLSYATFGDRYHR